MSDQPTSLDAIAQADAKQAQSMRGRHARAILENPVYAEVFQLLRAEVLEALSGAALTDPSRLVLLTMQLQQLDRLAYNLTSMVRGGEQADEDLEQLRKRAAAEQERKEREMQGFIARGMRNARSAFASRQ